MKKIYQAIAIIAAASLLIGCSKEQANEPTPLAKEKITLTAGNPETKTYGIETIRFNAHDHLSVFDSEGDNNDFENASAGTSVSFEGEITSGSTPLFAVYPYTDAASISGSIVTTSIADHYRATTKNSILRGMNLSIGEITGSAGSYSAELKNVCGIVGVQIPADVIGISNIKLTANESLAGNVSIDYNSGVPSVVSAPDGAKSVDFDIPADNGLQFNDCKFYFSLIPGTYTGIKITITLLNGQTKEFSSSNPLTVVRNGRKLLKNLTLAEVQDVPAGDLTLTLPLYTTGKDGENVTQGITLYQMDGSTKTYLPKAAGSALTGGATYWYDQDGYSYPFYLCANNSSTAGSIYYRIATVNTDKLVRAVRISGSTSEILCYIKTPAIPGKKLTQVQFYHQHESTSNTTLRLRICGNLNDEGGNSSDASKDYYTGVKAAMAGTTGAAGTVASIDVTGSQAGQSYYIYHKHAYMNLSKLNLVYTAVD